MSIQHTITEIEKKIGLGLNALDLAAHFGGIWGEHPEHSIHSWQVAVREDETRQGYWEWVQVQIDLTESPDPDDGAWNEAPIPPEIEAQD